MTGKKVSLLQKLNVIVSALGLFSVAVLMYNVVQTADKLADAAIMEFQPPTVYCFNWPVTASASGALESIGFYRNGIWVEFPVTKDMIVNAGDEYIVCKVKK